MDQTARMLRWTASSISFWKPPPNTNRDIEITLISNISSYQSSNQQTYTQQYHKLQLTTIQSKNRTRGTATEFYRRWIQTYVGVISLQSVWLLIWNVINYFAMGLLLVQLLLMLLYDTIVPSSALIVNFNQLTRYLIFSLYILDMLVVRYRVQVQINGKMVKQPDILLMMYVKKLFLVDLLTIIFTMVVFTEKWYWQYLRVLIFGKYLTGIQIDTQIRYKLISLPMLSLIYSFLKFILGLVFWTTLYACIYLIIDLSFIDQQGEYYYYQLIWLTGSPSLGPFDLYHTFGWEIWFEYALLFVLQTMRGCGYGTVTPRNPPEFLFANIAILTLMAMFAYFTKRIIDISVRYSIEKEELLLEATSNLRTLQLSYSVGEEDMMKYLEQRIRKENKSYQVIEQLAESAFSEDLKHQFRYTFKWHFIFASHFLKQISQNQEGNIFRMELSQLINHKKSFKGEYLYKAGFISQEVLYLSEEGRVRIVNQALGVNTTTNNWQFSGIRQFFIDKRPIFDIISASTLILYFIEKQPFWQTIKKYRTVFEGYCQEIDSIKINRCKTQLLGLICYNCKHYHLFQQCSQLNSYRDCLHLPASYKKQKKAEEKDKCARSGYVRKRVVGFKMHVGLQIAEKDCYYPSREYFICHNI